VFTAEIDCNDIIEINLDASQKGNPAKFLPIQGLCASPLESWLGWTPQCSSSVSEQSLSLAEDIPGVWVCQQTAVSSHWADTTDHSCCSNCGQRGSANPDTYVDVLVWWLAIHHGLVVSVPTLRQNPQEAGLIRKMLHKLAAERDEALRDDWREFVLENSQGICCGGRDKQK
jgi:hypothetical protein